MAMGRGQLADQPERGLTEQLEMIPLLTPVGSPQLKILDQLG